MNRVRSILGRRLRRRLAPLGILIAVMSIAGAAFVATPASTASAAACYGRSCMGNDPYALNCTAASSITRTYTSGSKVATIVNEYSRVCNANWVFAYENPDARAAGWWLNLGISTRDSTRAYEFMCSPYPAVFWIGGGISEQCATNYNGANGWPMWTDMVDGTNMSYGGLYIYPTSEPVSGTEIGLVVANQ